MTIPCPTCERQNECRRDQRCNRPQTEEAAVRELEVRIHNLRAALLHATDAATVLMRRYREKAAQA